MEIIKITEINDLKEQFYEIESFLLNNESYNNLGYGLINSILKQERKFDKWRVWILKKTFHEIVGVLVNTDFDKGLIVSVVKTEIAKFIGENYQVFRVPNGEIIGEKENVITIMKSLNYSYETVMDQGVYELKKEQLVIPDFCENLKLSLLTKEFYELVLDWGIMFGQECFPKKTLVEINKEITSFLTRNFKRNSIFILRKSGVPVSMACQNRETKNSQSISFVFTPKEHRGQGYGSLVTGLISKNSFDEKGKIACNLYTDLTNPTSNSIYKKLGYVKLGESLHVRIKI